MRTRGREGSKNPNFVRTYFKDEPLNKYLKFLFKNTSLWKYEIFYTKVDINCNLNSFKVLFGNYLEKYLKFFFKNTNWLTKWGLSADIKWMNNNFKTLRHF